jgi:hypothetical protein
MKFFFSKQMVPVFIAWSFAVAALFSTSFADVVVLRDGMSAKTEILDTIGCKIKIRRNGNVVEIDKTKVSYIVLKSDSISYKQFTCTPEIAAQKSNAVFEDGYNCERVNSMIGKMRASPSAVRMCLLYYSTEPVNGVEFQTCWKDKFAVFEKELKKKYPNSKPVNNEEMYSLLKNQNDTNCILIPYQAKFAYVDSRGKIGDFDMIDFFGKQMITGARAYVKSTVDIKIVDLKCRQIVFDDTAQFMEAVSRLELFTTEKEEFSEMKARSLENALLNSIDRTREILTKMFGMH